MIPVFPSRPGIELSGYTITPVPNIRRTEFESGPHRQAARNSRQMFERSIKLNCCDTDCFAEVKTFIHDTLKFGALWFMFDCPDVAALGGTTRIRARIKSGEVTYSPNDKDMSSWSVTFTLESWGV